ncbi:MAG TPA: tetratricopeptide repeat protein [Gammaproteobacteria bacterium]|nr:tetratricopeptide repeat protein [Gammaproteobacteria bacterium]
MSDQPTELSIEDALQNAIQLHRAGKLDVADTWYRRILSVAPDYPDAIHFRGLLLHQRDRSDEGLALIERSIALDPTAGRHNNLAIALLDRQRFEEAVAAFERSVQLDPRDADVLNNLGSIRNALGRTDEAEQSLLAALEANPGHFAALTNLGNLRAMNGRTAEAIDLYWKVLSVHPGQEHTRRMLGFAYYQIGDYESAANVFRKWLESEPDNPTAKHMVAACSGVDVPARASDEYVEKTFDAFAQSFDSKLAVLQYRAPQLVCDALGKVAGAPARDLAILDAGCGTGLCGPLLAPYASRLVGVDLSARMLDAARARGGYHELVKGELTEHISALAPGGWDVIVSADTLCYFGELDAVFAATARALRDGGVLIFTVEAAEPDGAPQGFRINPHGRYSHTRAYLERSLGDAGLAVETCEPHVLRTENTKPVDGFLVTSTKLPRRP